MEYTTPPAISATPVPWRLFAAFLLGLPIGPYPIIPAWLQWIAPVITLAVAMLISIQLDPFVRKKKTGELALRASWLALVVMGIIVVAMAVLIGVGSGIAGLALIPLGVSLAVTFSVGSSQTLHWALGCGLAAWFGVSIHLLAGIAIFATSSESALGNIIIALTAIEVMVGMVIAIPGALLGISLRVWLLGRPSTPSHAKK